jgi:hypothetical protein
VNDSVTAAYKKLYNTWFIKTVVCYVGRISGGQGEEQLDGRTDISKVKAFNNGDATDGLSEVIPMCYIKLLRIIEP